MTSSQIFWNGSCVTAASPSTTCAPVTYNASTTQLSVTIPAAYIAKASFPQISVVNPFPGGPSRIALTFTISAANNPVPTVTSLAPSNTPVGVPPPGGIITVNGTAFIATSTVSFNGIPRATQFVNATHLTATVLASDVAKAGAINVQVSNPSPGGGVSTGSTFTVGPVPAATLRKAPVSGVPFSLELISVSAAGGAANGRSSRPASSYDGRFVTFYSEATNLVASGASASIFVRDTCNGVQNCTPQTIAADLDVNGNAPSAPASEQFAISADGEFVAFSSSAENLVAGLGAVTQSEGARVYVRNLCQGSDVPAGCTPQTNLASVDPLGNSINGAFPAISADGRFVAFVSAPKSSTTGMTPQAGRVYVRDTCAGSTANSACAPTTVALDLSGGGAEAAGPLAISADGRYVAYSVSASVNASSSQQNVSAILAADTCEGLDASGGCVAQAFEASVAADGSRLPGQLAAPSISEDGRFIAFDSAGSVSTGAPKVFLRDTCLGQTAPNGCVPSTTNVADNAAAPSISTSGRYITYVSEQTAPTAAGTDRAGWPYVYDTCFGATAPCAPSASPAASAGVQGSGGATISSDGGFVVFASKAALGQLPSSGLGDVYLVAIAH